MMNRYVKEFFLRGLIFGGFGPIIAGAVYLFTSMSVSDFFLNGKDVFIAILSTYVLAFVQAGVSVFNQVEHWSLAKSLLVHFGSLYVVYIVCYLINTWIPFNLSVILIFTIIFVVTYLAIWLTVYLIVRNTNKKLNKNIISRN